MKKISVAVVGLGYWGPNLVRNILKVAGVHTVYGCDKDAKALKKITVDFPNIKLVNNFSSILENRQISAVIIATPLHTHFSLAKSALLSQKHVLIEKPMTANSLEANELITLAKQKKKILMTGHTFVYSETVKKIKHLIEKKRLGKMYYYDSTRINLGLIQKDANVIWDLASHDLAILSYLFKEKPLSVQAFGTSYIEKNIELAHIFIRFQKNISAHIHVSWLSPVKIRTILIAGNKKMVVYNDIEPTEKLKIYDKGITPSPQIVTPFSPAYRSGDVVIPRLEQKEALFNEVSHFIDCIQMNKQPITHGLQGLQVVRLLEAIDKAFTSHSEIFL